MMWIYDVRTYLASRYKIFYFYLISFIIIDMVQVVEMLPHERQGPGPRFNIKILSYQYRKSHCGDKTVVRSSYLHNGISYTGKITSLYWIRALFILHSRYHYCWWPDDARSQDISSNGINPVLLSWASFCEYFGEKLCCFCSRRELLFRSVWRCWAVNWGRLRLARNVMKWPPRNCSALWRWVSGAWFNITMLFYQYRKSHCGDKMIIRSSCLHSWFSYTGNIVSLYWISPQVICTPLFVCLIALTAWKHLRNFVNPFVGR